MQYLTTTTMYRSEQEIDENEDEESLNLRKNGF